MDAVGTFVDRADVGVAPVLLGTIFAQIALSAHASPAVLACPVRHGSASGRCRYRRP
jgi:hypothetical protein